MPVCNRFGEEYLTAYLPLFRTNFSTEEDDHRRLDLYKL